MKNDKKDYNVPWYIFQGAHYPGMQVPEIEKAYNGIGPSWFTPWIRARLDALLSVFYFAVIIHDCDYEKGLSLWEKIRADFRFLLNMLCCVACQLYADNLNKAIRFAIYAAIIYILLLLFGRFAYWTDEKKGKKTSEQQNKNG